jgi:ankyrin repeat protein
VIGDCCGDCPAPVTIEEEEAAEQESKIYVSGPVKFMKDDCGRQTIGSFNPLSPEQYTDMAYVGNTQLLCQAIIDQDLHYVEQWLSQEGNDPSTRDHTGRCPLHLAVTSSSVEIVQCLIDHGARLVARLVDGKTALHLACLRGDTRIVAALLKKSEANEEEEANKTDAKRKLRLAAKETQNTNNSTTPTAPDTTFEMVDELDAESDVEAVTDGSMVNIKAPETNADEKLDMQDDDSPDFYDVNVLTWDTPTSPLHLAILNGHLDVVQCLVEEFGANILLPMVFPTGSTHYQSGAPGGALLTLALATKLPLDKAKEMTRLLFKLGASCAQADSKRKTALEYCVASAPDLLQTYLDADPTGAARALRNVTVQGSIYNVQVYSPLMTAISNEDTETALRLLSAGARADIPLETFLKGVDTATKHQFEETVQQPVIVAVEEGMPLIAATLVEHHGIDCNTMTGSSWRMVHNSYDRNRNGETLLDLVKIKVKQLRDWKHEKSKHVAPHPLKDDSEYLGDYPVGTYHFWSATQQLKLAKTTYDREWKSYVEESRRIADNEENGAEEKQAAIYDKLDQFRKLETLLEKRSAKTFKELHPGIEGLDREARQQRGYGRYWLSPREPFEVEFEFVTMAMPSDEVREKYVSLFNSTWQGDVRAIKELTTLPWTNAKGEQCPPLQVHMFDNCDASPLSIAVLNGRLDVAELIMRIAETQYAPPPPPSARQYHIDNDEDSDDDENDNDSVDAEVRVTSEVIDDQLTVEDIGMVSHFVKTNVKPETMIYWSKTDVNPYHASAPSMGNLIEVALLHDENPRLLPFLLDLSEETVTKIEGSFAADRFVAQGHLRMRRALMFAKPYMLAELIKRTAVGASIDLLAMDHKANDATEKSKYYQGLNVHGKKRKDWAAAGRNSAGMDKPSPQTPPLLLAAYHGTIDHVQWFMSDAPLQCYKQFAETYKDDKRLRRLSKVPGGFEGMVENFMNTRSQLAIHCCVARHQTADSVEILKYLVKVMPGAVEARSADGMTPLLLAYRAHNLEAVKVLLEAGADQTVRDKEGMNLLHHITATTATFVVDIAHIRNLIETIDKRLISGMCLQRCSRSPGSLTPLALLVAQYYVSNEIRVDMARLILEYSQGAELELLNGEGHTPLHVVARTDPTQIRHHHFKLASVIAEHRPNLVAWENATGKSPLEMVEDKILACKCSDPTHMPSKRSRRHYGYGAPPSIADARPQSFLKSTIDVEKALEDLDTNLDSDESVSASQRVERLEKLLRDTQAKLDAEGKGKRRLVTLNEASEVARRLAAVQRQRVEKSERAECGEQDDVEQDPPLDEVEGWLRDPRKCSGPLQ